MGAMNDWGDDWGDGSSWGASWGAEKEEAMSPSDRIRDLKKKNRSLKWKQYERNGKDNREETLRNANPGLKDLWEQYQIMIQLVDKGN